MHSISWERLVPRGRSIAQVPALKIEDRRVGIYNPDAMWGLLFAVLQTSAAGLAEGRELYRLRCAECHGGEGGDTGGELFRIYLGGDGLGGIGGGAAMYAAPITYEVKGKQYVSMSSGSALFTFFLPE